MTRLLEKAIKKISDLPEIEQDEIAKIILSELEDENIWYMKFANSQSELSILADEARRENQKGKTKPMDL
ncbi:MAG: hypothetical protein M3R36_16605 [Bacteroidota bacterium]|nr:hypothetical protein [Bacteroidota bacterium]